MMWCMCRSDENYEVSLAKTFEPLRGETIEETLLGPKLLSDVEIILKGVFS